MENILMVTVPASGIIEDALKHLRTKNGISTKRKRPSAENVPRTNASGLCSYKTSS